MKIAFAACALLLAVGGLAAPTSFAETRSLTLRLADFDLSRPADVTRLAKRINRAVNEICNQSKPDDDFDAYERDRACRVAAISRALTDISNPMLTARFDNERLVRLARR
jgi:UrcA family protein